MTRRRHRSAVPIVIVVVLLLVGLIGSTFTPSAAPPPSSAVPTFAPVQAAAQTPLPAPTPLGRYPASSETAIVGACVSGIDPNTVPTPIGQAFCICTLNTYEQLYPTYDAFQQAIAAGTLTGALKTQVSDRCTQAVVGG